MSGSCEWDVCSDTLEVSSADPRSGKLGGGGEFLGAENKCCALLASSRALSPVVLFINAMFDHSFPVALAQAAVGYFFLCIGVQIGEAATAFCGFNAVVLKEPLYKFSQCRALRPSGVDCLPQLLLLRIKNRFLRCLALLNEQGVFIVQPGLSTLLGVVFPVCDLLLSAGQQVNLVQPTLLAHGHNLLPKVAHQLPGTAMLSSGTAVAGSVHVGLALHILNSQGVDDNVTVQIPSSVVPIWMRADQRLVAGEMGTAKRFPHFLSFLQCEAVVVPVPGVEGNDVVVSFDVAFLLVLAVLEVCLHAVQGEAVRGAEHAGDEIFLAGNVVTVLVQNGTVGLLIVLKREIELGSSIIGVFAGNVLDDCH